MDATSRPSQQLINAQKELAHRRKLAGVAYPVRNVEFGIRNSDSSAVPTSRSPHPQHEENLQSEIINHKSAVASLPTPHSKLRTRISPTLAAHCLDKNNRHNNASLDGPYRLYKILQALDEHGRGWLANSDVEPILAKKGSPFYIYGRRQLKIILRRGEGLFWQRVKSGGQVRIRLVSRAKLAQALDCGRLRGREVSLPLSYLLGSGRGRQANANAALYATVHAGRFRPDRGPRGETNPRPISRSKLQELAGCSLYRQRSYEKRMKIDVRANIHILGPHSDYELQRVRQHLGLPAYKHTDYQGQVNRHQRGAAYIAVRLPNSYRVPDTITVVQSLRQRTTNRLLDGLCHLGSGGSDREQIVRLFHRDAATAASAYQRDQENPTYWPLASKGNTSLWQNLTVRSEQLIAQTTKVVTTNPTTTRGKIKNPTAAIDNQMGVI